MTSLFSLILSMTTPAKAETVYQKPEKQIDELIEAQGFSQPIMNWQKTALIKAYYEEMPSIEYVSRPQLKLAGARFNGVNYTSIANVYLNRLVYFDIKTGTEKPIAFPKGSILREVLWSPDGKKLVVSIEKEKSQELWLVRIPSLKKSRMGKIELNAVLRRTITWIDDERLLIGARTKDQKNPVVVETTAPKGPIIQKTDAKVSQNRTFADLLKTPQDEKAFIQAIDTQLVIYDVETGKTRKFGEPLLLNRIDISPNKKFVLVESLLPPFSRVVPYSLFGKKIEIWNMQGKKVHSFLVSSAHENLPIQGVPTGPRSVQWIRNEPQTLVYVEALDKGDWEVKVDFREEIFKVPMPEKGKLQPQSVMKLQNRFAGFSFFEEESTLVVYDYERDRQWFRTLLVENSLSNAWTSREMFSLSANDDYGNPGDPVMRRDKNGEAVVAVEKREGKRFIYLSGRGASPEGDRPFLRRLDLSNFEQKEVFRSDLQSYERFGGFADDRFERFFTSYQSRTESPRFFTRELYAPEKKELLYADPNPYEIFGKIKKEVITYKRQDGVLLSGILYYPLNYKAGKKYPAIVQAYPLEYTDASVAGQVRGSQNRFSIPFREDIVYNALRGYIVLDEAQMPIIGHPETKNDTFIEQLVSSAKAAVDTLDERGLIDRKRVGIIGHSYGAFMVAHLLTHSDLFATGIAKSGAYNRTLTPFGFQGERRPFWKAKETYIRMSPFMDVEKMKRPLLLMHGMADNNAGTLTMQTERYFEALKGQGANAKLVLLPEESHGYSAKESIQHVLHEIFAWFDTYLKEPK